MNEYQIAMREEYNKQQLIDVCGFIISVLVVFAIPTISILFFGVVGVVFGFIWIGYILALVFFGRGW